MVSFGKEHCFFYTLGFV
ncbi:hypothetical protein ZEAMMB73_Zm00001d048468 [Zea mays]|nr:hypothetical protein ZEAMMB73_Zm00001d048468 [Zea mays]